MSNPLNPCANFIKKDLPQFEKGLMILYKSLTQLKNRVELG